MGRTALEVNVFQEFIELRRCQDRSAPYQTVGGRQVCSVPSPPQWEDKQVSGSAAPAGATWCQNTGSDGGDYLGHQRGAMCWPLLLFCKGNAAGSSLHHEVLYLQISVNLLLPPVLQCLLQLPNAECPALVPELPPPNTHTGYQYNQTLHPSIEKKWRVFKITAVF